MGDESDRKSKLIGNMEEILEGSIVSNGKKCERRQKRNVGPR